jgi:gamma-glutamylcyclotransferase (GGCT)/AIG2-like uncharacterized protein YtfP
MAVTFKLFVYATFLEGEADHEIIADGTLVGPAKTAKGYRLVEVNALGGMIEGGDEAVVGELYEVEYDTLAACDKKRDHPHLFHRVEIDLEDGTRAHTFLMHSNQVRGKRRVKDGDWRARFKGERPTAGNFVNWAKSRYRR